MIGLLVALLVVGAYVLGYVDGSRTAVRVIRRQFEATQHAIDAWRQSGPPPR